MKTIFIGVLVLLLFVGGVLLGRHFYVKWKFRKLIVQKYNVVQPLIEKLASTQAVTEREVFALAQKPALRHAVYQVLKTYNQETLFPSMFMVAEKAAESFLVMWLEFPTELGEVPHAIELVTTVTLPEIAPAQYFVFKFRMMGQHALAANDWMLGVVGPYDEKTLPYQSPLRTFSRFTAFAEASAEAEVRWVHEHIHPHAG